MLSLLTTLLLASAAHRVHGKVFEPGTTTTLAAAVVDGVSGYGRFPCTRVEADGSFSPDQSMCNSTALQNPDPTGQYLGLYRGSSPNPTNPQCAQEPETGGYYCGIAGAACETVENCDNGYCSSDGVCEGGLGADCAGQTGQGDDSLCLGFLYCTSLEQQTASNQCGGIGAFCQDWSAIDVVGNAGDAAAVNRLTGNFCTSGFCRQDGNCGELASTLGASCANEPFICGPGLTPSDPSGGTGCECIAKSASGPSQRARSRRASHYSRNYRH
ncbi:hypothetical protein JCM10908_005346 [Rhodotorula pacifica]|uniref:uncharacterized protein n=1 Tax=Rhodotorula pacifica TaxID=1495444 RepID=UPI0031722FF6